MGFEPTRTEHIGLAVQRLNHSATSSCYALIVSMLSVLETKFWKEKYNYAYEAKRKTFVKPEKRKRR